MSTDAMDAAKIVQDALEDKLAEDIRMLDLRGLSNIADCFVIASGKNVNHLRAMADEVEQKLFAAGVKLHHSEGYSRQISVLVHLFNKEERAFYGLEHVWGDAKDVVV